MLRHSQEGSKSRVALEYCHAQKQQKDVPDVFWVHGASRTKFEASYQELAHRMNVPGRNDKERDIMLLVRSYLNESTERVWFMVVDNADDSNIWLKPGSSQRYPKPLIEYLPLSSRGKSVFGSFLHNDVE